MRRQQCCAVAVLSSATTALAAMLGECAGGGTGMGCTVALGRRGHSRIGQLQVEMIRGLVEVPDPG